VGFTLEGRKAHMYLELLVARRRIRNSYARSTVRRSYPQTLLHRFASRAGIGTAASFEAPEVDPQGYG
jgi:hypothetical protein